MRTLRKHPRSLLFENEPLWYKDALIYQLHVRAFCDSNSDGIGDFSGLTEKLDYLQDLGDTALWLLPFYPSPLRDDGYDVTDYTYVHPNYGTLHDFKTFLREAHRRGQIPGMSRQRKPGNGARLRQRSDVPTCYPGDPRRPV